MMALVESRSALPDQLRNGRPRRRSLSAASRRAAVCAVAVVSEEVASSAASLRICARSRLGRLRVKRFERSGLLASFGGTGGQGGGQFLDFRDQLLALLAGRVLAVPFQRRRQGGVVMVASGRLFLLELRLCVRVRPQGEGRIGMLVALGLRGLDALRRLLAASFGHGMGTLLHTVRCEN